jgi:hypothetical protein
LDLRPRWLDLRPRRRPLFAAGACIGGSSVYILSAPSPAGPWRFRGDVGSNPTPFDAHSADNYVTRAQGSAILQIGGSGPAGQTLWLGNQWNSGLRSSPPGPRNHDLLYWALLEFEEGEAAAVKQLTRQPEVTVIL